MNKTTPDELTAQAPSTGHETGAEVARLAEQQFEHTVAELSAVLTVPAISCEPAHAPDVTRLAELVRQKLDALGFQARVRQLPGALPLVSAERDCGRPDAPTLLIYGHLDLQPVAGEVWNTPPHQATRLRAPDGERLYARGAADDMGGWMSHLAAVRAWLSHSGELPLSVKFIIESEEEIGSPNLERYMDAYAEDFAADVMVLTDCENPSLDIPGLTTSLRGLYEVDVCCEALASDVHSGIWGNMAPDVSSALVHVLSRLSDQEGRPTFALQQVDDAFVESARQVPLDAEVVESGAHLLPGVRALEAKGRTPAEWLWRQPAVTVLSTTLPRPDQHKNALRASARASLSIRIPPGCDRTHIRNELERIVLKDPPGGVLVRLEEHARGAESWLYRPEGAAFDAADRAYQKAWGRPLVQIGIGGSIPFVALFGRRYAHLPLILNGVMDPLTGAHGPNESLHLGVFKKAILANVYLYEELARAGSLHPA